MIKRILIMIIILFIVVSFPVHAKSYLLSNNQEIHLLEDGCGLLGDPEKDGSIAYYAQKAFDIFKYAGLIAVAVLTVMDFAKAIFSNDKEVPKNLAKNMITRLILAAFLFFLPLISNLILKLIGVYGDCGIG